MPTRPKFAKHLSLRNRLLAAAALWLGVMILIAGLLIPNLIKTYLEDDIKSQLSLSMDELTANLDVSDTGQLVMPYRLSDPRFSQPYSGLYWMASSEHQVLRSRSLWDQVIKFKRFHSAIGANGEKLISIQRDIYLPDFSKPITITIGTNDDALEHTLDALTGQLWLILSLLFAGVLILIGFQVTWSLRPLGKMQKELNLLKDGKQNQLDGDYPKEIQPLLTDLNALLFHYQELLARARNHAGNLSHALKTPISVLKNEVAQLPPEQQSKMCPPLMELQQHIDYHLGRARMAGSMNILSVSSLPSERVDAISLAFDKVYAQRDIILINEIDTELQVAVEKADLDEMLGNLLENGYKWAQSQIRVHSKEIDGKQVQLIIEDDGPGIDKSSYQEVLKRGVRLDESTPGTGLGLNIVCEMAHSYRGSLNLGSSERGGLKTILTLQIHK